MIDKENKPKSGVRLARLPAKLKSSAFAKNLAIVMAGTGFSQVIGFLLSPVISRLFSPSDFGIFGSFAAVSGIIAAGVTLDYSQAIMLPKEKEQALNLLAVSFFCAFVISAMCLSFCVIAPGTVSGILKMKSAWVLALLILATIVSGVNQTCQAWSVRVKAFKQTSASQVIRSVTANSSRIGFGFIKAGSAGLIISNILADTMASINLFRVLLPDLSAWRGRIRWAQMKKLAKEYRDFPMYSASQNVINSLSNGLPILLLTRSYGIAAAGAYAFGINMIQAPMGFVMGALRQVLFQKASESQHQGRSIAALYIKTTAGLFAISLVPLVVLVIWAPQIFTLIFGSRWLLAGEFARGLVIWLATSFCNVPAVLFARIIRIQRFVFFYDLALLAARTAVLVLGGLYLGSKQTVLLFSIVGAAMNGFLIYRVGRAVMKKEGSSDFDSFREFLIKP